MSHPRELNPIDLSRRRFVITGTGLLLSSGLTKLSAQAHLATESVHRPVLHIIGHSHIDAAWLWPWHDSADIVLTTFRSALDRMEETPDFRYTHSSTIHYQWVQAASPSMFEEILRRIREGRWEVVGGWPVEPDCNIPSTESFARHCLYGKGYCASELGVNVNIGFNPDSFGHAAGLPTILTQAGYGYYVFLRPQEHEADLPRLFWWVGPDGSRVLAYRIYGNYDSSVEHLKEAIAHVFPPGSEHGAFFLGVGDHGGAVTKAQIQEILAMRQDPALPELRWSTMREYFASVENLPNIPVVKGDLQHHARGCYSACGEEKLQNRRAEQVLVDAESIDVVASRLQPHGTSVSRFKEAWERVLFNQFHDLLAGTSLYSDYQEARDGLGYACEIAEESAVTNLEILAKQVDLHDVPESAVFVYNTLPWRRKALLEFRYRNQTAEEKVHSYTHLKTREGIRIAAQTRPSDSMSDFFPLLSAWVELPPCGYEVLTVEHGNPPAPKPFPECAAIADGAFGLRSFCAQDGTELLADRLGMVVIEDKSDTWAHDVVGFNTELGRPTFLSSELVESGPVTRVTRQRMQWRSSSIVVDIAEFADLDVIEFRFVIDWHEHEQILKMEVPTRLSSPRVIAKVPGAAIERNVNGNEEPYQDWVTVQGEIQGKSYTVTLINNGTYSYDCLKGRLRTILIRSAPYARHNPNPVEKDGINAWQDQGRQERRFWLVRSAGTWVDIPLDRLGRELQTPARYVLDSRHPGAEPWTKSYLEIGPDGVEVLALKGREDGAAIVVRLQERTGKRTTAYLRCPPLKLDKKVQLSPWEIRTLQITNDPSKGTQVKTVSLLEE
jgi:alpha-mannosidase